MPRPTRTSLNPTDVQVAAATRSQPSRRSRPAAAGRASAAARSRSGLVHHRRGRGVGKADRIAAETAYGDGRSPRAGRPHGECDRADRPHAGAPRHPPQAPRDVGFRKERRAACRSRSSRNRCSTTRTPGCGAPWPRTTPRAPQDRTRAPQERTRMPQERTRAPQERVTRAPQSGTPAPGTAACAPGSVRPGIVRLKTGSSR